MILDTPMSQKDLIPQSTIGNYKFYVRVSLRFSVHPLCVGTPTHTHVLLTHNIVPTKRIRYETFLYSSSFHIQLRNKITFEKKI